MTLNLKAKWYYAILFGIKDVEYREIKEYWTKRLSKIKSGDIVTFRLGYHKTHDDIRAKVTKIDIGSCPYQGWSGDYYRIHFTKVKV